MLATFNQYVKPVLLRESLYSGMLLVALLPDWLLILFHFIGFLEIFQHLPALKDSSTLQQYSAR